ncbi:lytic transglycosylase domain-containing protein [Ammoniphilus sp. CFH 90114]|nr:lytic transglycosylase domain-containing protein [Ammoniphilus sp. CFH 90114]
MEKVNQAYGNSSFVPVSTATPTVEPTPAVVQLKSPEVVTEPSKISPPPPPPVEQKPLVKKEGPLNTAPPKVKDYIERVAKEVNVDPNLLAAIAHNESGFRLSARSSAGAIGLFQLMPSTAKELGVNPHDPYQNVLGGAKYIKDKIAKYDGDIRLALAAYNAGPGNVDRAIKKAGNVKDWDVVQAYLPRETQRFVPKVLRSYT